MAIAIAATAIVLTLVIGFLLFLEIGKMEKQILEKATLDNMTFCYAHLYKKPKRIVVACEWGREVALPIPKDFHITLKPKSVDYWEFKYYNLSDDGGLAYIDCDFTFGHKHEDITDYELFELNTILKNGPALALETLEEYNKQVKAL